MTKTKRVYMTRKRKIKQTMLKTILILTAIALGASIIGTAEQNIEAHNTANIDWKARRVLPVAEDRADLTVEEQIRAIAKKKAFKWTDYLVRLAFLESSFNTKAINVNRGGSIDRGLFQWNDRWHPEILDECAFDLECATLKTMEAINNGNQHWWATDKLAQRK